MQYFFIAGNVASLAAFIGFLLQLSQIQNGDIFRWITFGAVCLTVLFWLYFYAAPQNRVSTTIARRLDYSGRYSDSSQQAIEVAEGEFDIKNYGEKVVAIPPFESVPDVVIYTPKDKSVQHPPTVSSVTRDSFTVLSSSSTAHGTWRFRARGKALTPTTRTA